MGLTDLEHAALSGELFQPRSNSPTRSDSTSSPLNTDDELASDLDEDDDHKHKDGFVSQRRSGAVKGERGESTTALIEPQEGPRTGIKGVINDQKAHTAYTESETKDKAQELRKRMERTAITTKAPLSTKTISGAGPGAGGDEKENGDLDVDGREGWRKRRIMEMESTRKGLKELGKTGFVHAVEKAGWVLVLIYEPVRLLSIVYSAHSISFLGKVRSGPGAHLILTLYCPVFHIWYSVVRLVVVITWTRYH